MKKNHINTYFRFTIDKIEFACDILEVSEITEPTPLRKIIGPFPSYYKGIFNLRGNVVTALNFADLIGTSPSFNPKLFAVLKCPSALTAIGIDKSSGMIALDNKNIDDSVNMHLPLPAKYCKGICSVNATTKLNVISLLDFIEDKKQV